MGSVCLCPDYLTHAETPDGSNLHDSNCLSATNDTVLALYAALDPTFITAQIRRGVLSSSIFKQIAAAMKIHCAPVRDAMVDEIVTLAEGRNTVAALRKVFECVEIMKLDIANHKIQAVRSQLWKSTVPFEISAFRQAIIDRNLLESSVTRHWIRDASTRVLRSARPDKRAQIIASQQGYVVRAINEGIMELVCAPPRTETWPPIGPRRRAARPAATTTVRDSTMPESLQYDTVRIENHKQETRELAFVHLLLTSFRAAFEAENLGANKAVIDAAMSSAKSEIDSALDEGAVAFAPDSDSPSDVALRLACIVCPASSANDPSTVVNVNKVRGWADVFDQHATPSTAQSSTFLSILQCVRKIMVQLLDGRLLAVLDFNSLNTNYASARRDLQGLPTATDIRVGNQALLAAWTEEVEAKLEREGMTPLKTSLLELSARMARFARYHHGVFKNVYAGKGMLTGR